MSSSSSKSGCSGKTREDSDEANEEPNEDVGDELYEEDKERLEKYGEENQPLDEADFFE